MSKEVEERVVSMEFDNRDFEKNVKTSMSSLEKFKSKLRTFKDGAEDITYFAQAMTSVTFNKFQQGAEMSVGKVLKLAAALTGVVNITDKLYSTVTTTFRSLSTDQITRGWSKYEEKTEAVQTIMASTRKETESEADAMARVNKEIERLNWFTDETSYNLTDMVSNIGKFTSVGVELHDAVTAMEGIALAAAQAGVKTNDASRAMYNFSQAMAVGALERIDYKTINQMGMSTVQFKKQAMEAAEAAGTLKKIRDGVYETIKIADNESSKAGITVDISTFEDTLRYDWLGKDAMMELFKYYGQFAEYVREVQKADETVQETIARLKEEGDYEKFGLSAEAFEHGQEAKTLTEAFDAARDAASTKWMQAFEAVFGNYLEAKKLWTDLSQTLWEVFAQPADSVQQILYMWKKMQGRAKFLNGITLLWENFSKVTERVGEIFTDIFPTGEDIAKMLNKMTGKFQAMARNFEGFVNNLMKNQALWDNITTFVQGLKDGLDVIKELGKSIFEHVVNPFFNKSGDMIFTFSELLAKFGSFLTIIKETVVESDAFNKAFEKIESIIITVIECFGKLNNALFETFGNSAFKKISEESGVIAASIDSIGSAIAIIIQKAFDFITNAVPYIKMAFSWIESLFKGIGTVLKDLYDHYVKPIVKEIGSFLNDIVSSIFVDEKDTDSLVMHAKGGMIQVSNIFETFGNWCKAKGMKALNAIKDWLIKAMEWATPIFDAFSRMLGLESAADFTGKIMQMLSNTTDIFAYLLKMVYTIVGIIVKINQFKGLKNFSLGGLLFDFKAEQLTNVVNNITRIPKDLARELRAGVKDITKIFKYQAFFNGLSSVLLSLGGSFLMIATAMKLISSIPEDDFKRATVSMGVILSCIMTIFFALLGQQGDSSQEYNAGYTTMVGTFLSSNKISSQAQNVAKKFAAMAAMLISVGAAVTLMAISMKLIASIQSPDRAVAALISVSSLLFELIVLSKKMEAKNAKELLLLSGAFFIMGSAVKTIAKAIRIIGKIPLENLTMAMLVIDDIFLMFGAMVTFANTIHGNKNVAENLLAMGVSMGTMSVGILAIAGSFAIMAKIPKEDLDKSIKILGKVALGMVGVMLAVGLIGKYSDKASSITASSLAILAMIAPILAIAGALHILKDLDPNNMESSAKAMATVLVAISGAVALMAVAFKNPKTGVMAALVLTALAAGLWALAPALEAFSKVNAQSIIITLGALATALAVIFGISQFLSKKGGAGSVEMTKLALSILAIGGAIMAVGAGAYLAAKSFEVVINTFLEMLKLGPGAVDNLLEIIVKLATGLPTIGLKIGEFVGNLIMGTFKGIGANKESAEMMAKFIKTLINAAKQSLPAFKELLEKILVALRDFVPNLNDFLYEVTANLFDYILDLLNEYIPKLNEHLENATIDLGKRLLNVLTILVPLLNKHLAMSAANLIAWVNQVIIYLAKTIVKGTINILEILRDNISTIVALTVEIGNMAVVGIIRGMVESVPLILEELAILFETVVDKLDELLEEHGPKLEASITKLGNVIVKALNEWVKVETAVGGSIYTVASNLVNGLGRSIIKAGIESNLFWRIGQKLGQKIIQGLKSKESLDEHSPSKAMEKIGDFAIQGLTGSLEKGKSKLSDIAGDMGSIIASSFTSHFGTPADIFNNAVNGLMSTVKDGFSDFKGLDMSSILGDFIDFNPTITPSLDLSQVESQSKSLENLFSSANTSSMVSAIGGTFSTPELGMDAVSQNDMLSQFMGKMQNYMDVQSYNSSAATNVNITLDGDAKKMLKVLKVENLKQTKATGVNQLLTK